MRIRALRSVIGRRGSAGYGWEAAAWITGRESGRRKFRRLWRPEYCRVAEADGKLAAIGRRRRQLECYFCHGTFHVDVRDVAAARFPDTVHRNALVLCKQGSLRRDNLAQRLYGCAVGQPRIGQPSAGIGNDLSHISAHGVVQKSLGSRGKLGAFLGHHEEGTLNLVGAVLNSGLRGGYAAYGQKNGEIAFDRTANTASKAGLYLSFDMLTAFVDNKALNNLIPELAALPLVVKGIPVTLSGHDYAKARYVTAATKALLLDTRVIDSAYYPLERLDGLNEKCTVDLLFIIDRLIPGIPLFISAHGTLNGIDCAEEESLSGEMSAEAQ